MKTESGHTNNNHSDWDKLEAMNSGLSVKWDESKEDIWARMGIADEQPAPEVKVIRMGWRQWSLAAAAVGLLLLGLTAFLRFYSTAYTIPAGEHLLVELPDASKVQLNAGSSLSYHPYWWAFSRDVKLEGEAYFEVQKGSRFQVESANGNTTVLGTSFNIYARDNNYRVTCLTGKVQVSNAARTASVILFPDEKAEWTAGSFIKTVVESHTAIAWTTNSFVFTASPINEVFREIERQYNVRLDVGAAVDFSYSGNFDKAADVRQVLGYVCRPFNLSFEETQPGTFRIEKNN